MSKLKETDVWALRKYRSRTRYHNDLYLENKPNHELLTPMRNIRIVGASSGIGKELAGQLVSAGNAVFGTYYEADMSSTPGIESFRHLQVLDDKLLLDYLPDRLDGLATAPALLFSVPTHGCFSDSQIVIRRIDYTRPRFGPWGYGDIILVRRPPISQFIFNGRA